MNIVRRPLPAPCCEIHSSTALGERIEAFTARRDGERGARELQTPAPTRPSRSSRDSVAGRHRTPV